MQKITFAVILMEVTPRETILKRVRQAVMEKTKNPFPDLDLDSPLLKSVDDDPAVQFADAFTSADGQFVYCANTFDFIDNFITLIETRGWTRLYCSEKKIQEKLADSGIEYINSYTPGAYIEAVISGCEALISRSGSVLISSRQQSRTLIHLAHAHVIVGYASQIARDIKDGFVLVKNHYGKDTPAWMGFITGPSRTADIERTKVIGVHGAKEIYVFLIDDREQPVS